MQQVSLTEYIVYVRNIIKFSSFNLHSITISLAYHGSFDFQFCQLSHICLKSHIGIQS